MAVAVAVTAASRLPMAKFNAKTTAAARADIPTMNQRLYLRKKDSAFGGSVELWLGVPVGPEEGEYVYRSSAPFADGMRVEGNREGGDGGMREGVGEVEGDSEG